jgi:hypothetical protein
MRRDPEVSHNHKAPAAHRLTGSRVASIGQLAQGMALRVGTATALPMVPAPLTTATSVARLYTVVSMGHKSPVETNVQYGGE